MTDTVEIRENVRVFVDTVDEVPDSVELEPAKPDDPGDYYYEVPLSELGKRFGRRYFAYDGPEGRGFFDVENEELRVRSSSSTEKEWVSDPTEEAPNRWTNIETGEHRYQEMKPGSSEDDAGDSEDDGSGEVDDGTDISSVEDLPVTEKVDTEISLDNEAQVSDISDYRAGSFSFVNEALRGSREMNQRTSQIVESVSDAIDEAGEFEEVTLYRGLEATPELADRFEEGEVVQLGGFQSASHDPSTASNFARTPDWDDERKDIIMQIDTTRGFPAYSSDELSEGIEGDEVILGHNWSYRVEGISEVGDKMKVNMSLVAGGNDE
ncbi:ADP-ribosyltransferase [Halovirus HCTV-5]|uniref:ADP-ribosyltransferase n=1 Tax=Halovirus HCTV-5 TaxID=1273748 RepID=UPI0003348648|nr:ADP-ribosyltransferase [Halovirus HCTV-5]AGM11717.1 ADP-ribosyltransferase [Halovirus HCTV-5]